MDSISEEDFKYALSIAHDTLPGIIPYDREYKINIKKKYDGLTLPELYRKVMPHINEDWKEKVLTGEILLEGRKSTVYEKVKAGQITSRIIKNIRASLNSITPLL